MMWLNKLLQFCIIMSFFSKKKLIDLFVHNKPVYSYIHCSQNRTVLCHERAWNKNNKRIKQFTIIPIEIHFHTILQRNNISEVKKKMTKYSQNDVKRSIDQSKKKQYLLECDLIYFFHKILMMLYIISF